MKFERDGGLMYRFNCSKQIVEDNYGQIRFSVSLCFV